MDSRLVFRSAIKLIKLVSGKVQIRKISLMNLPHIKQSANICGEVNFSSKLPMNMVAYDGAAMVPIAHPLTCK